MRAQLPRDAALALLGLEWPVTRAELDTAFRSKVRAAHPDAGGSGDVNALQTARDRLLAATEAAECGKNTSCALCKGSGKVRGRFGLVRCAACG